MAAEAFELGLLRIEETDGGRVPEIVAVNDASLPVLLTDGEHLEGAMQNRILNVSVLIAARQTTRLPVACVEQGRWGYQTSGDFRFSPDHSYGRLRRTQAEAVERATRAGAERRASQGEVWADVAIKHRELRVSSDSGAMGDAYDRHRARLSRTQRGLGSPELGQTGVLAAVAGRPSVVDLFDRPAAPHEDVAASGVGLRARRLRAA